MRCIAVKCEGCEIFNLRLCKVHFIFIPAAAAFIFAALLHKVFAFIVKACYNIVTKGRDAIALVIALKKQGVAAPGFFILG